MTVEATVPSTPAPTSTTALWSTQPTRAPKQELDSETFMQLLVTQLQNQDPTSPMDTNQMISQTTQLAEMEKLTDMATTSQDGFALQMRSAAAEMIGRTVEYADANGQVQTGTAGSVAYDGTMPAVKVGQAWVPLNQIIGVVADTSAPADPPADPPATA